MKHLIEYIAAFRLDTATSDLADELAHTRSQFDLLNGGDPVAAFENFVQRYNWLGNPANKARFHITENLARNLPGSMMQDYLVNVLIAQLRDHPTLRVFSEVRISFGRYPLWRLGTVTYASPAEKSDIAIGYLQRGEQIEEPTEAWPRPVATSVPLGTSVIPLVTVNSKVRVSQSEFFDWQGREQLMTKGNPHCLSLQVALRKEMDFDIVAAAQAGDKFFLLGSGQETNVVPNPNELTRLIDQIQLHLRERMG